MEGDDEELPVDELNFKILNLKLNFKLIDYAPMEYAPSDLDYQKIIKQIEAEMLRRYRPEPRWCCGLIGCTHWTLEGAAFHRFAMLAGMPLSPMPIG